jgi:multidrug efflux pump subunit AcrB
VVVRTAQRAADKECMWIVELALRRKYTVGVFCALLLFCGAFSIARMKADVLPSIDIPVVLVVWTYAGLPADQMEKRIVQTSERAYSMTVNGLSRVESRSIAGLGLQKLYFEPGADIGAAIAQINSVSATATRNMPPGTFPPIVLPYNAGNVPIAQLTISGPTHSEEELVDYAVMARLRLFTIPGLAAPFPYGGQSRQINVDVDPAAAASRGISVQEVLQSVLESNPNLPGGTARLGGTEYDVAINNNPANLDELRHSIVKLVDGTPVRVSDVANVYDGTETQESIVRVNGKRATYLALVRKAGASSLAVVDATKALLPLLRTTAPEGIEVNLDADQSVFVRAAMTSVLREAAIAAVLVTLLTWLALGSWRAVIIVATSIPLAACASLAGLYLCGQTINVMTLGGLSLAAGMLVDDATVEVENIHRNLRMGKPLGLAILDGAREIAMPALASTLAICVVFSPVILLTGPTRYLFIPLSLSVVFAMLASYVLSRTLVPALSQMLLASDVSNKESIRDRTFGWIQDRYARALRVAIERKRYALSCGVLALVGAGALLLTVGLDFFPEVDTGRLRLHVRAPLGTRLDVTEHILERVERTIRETIPANELDTISDTIGLPTFFNIAFIQTDSIGPQDAELLVSLSPGHRHTAEYRRLLRDTLHRTDPGVLFYFQSSDIISQVLDFGAAAPIDVQVEGRDQEKTFAIARLLRDRIREIPGTADVHVAQSLSHPALRVDVDRERAAVLGVSQHDVAAGLLTSLNSSSMVTPSYWLDPESSMPYMVAVQAPPLEMRDLGDVRAIPITSGRGSDPSLSPEKSPQLSNLATVALSRSSAVINHENVQRVVDVQANVEGRDLGSVTKEVARVVADLRDLPRGVRVVVRGRSESLVSALGSLGLGLLVAALLAYLLMVVLFQSWRDPLIVMVAVPGALAGVAVGLALTGSSLNVESFMGAIMAVGVAVANSILLVSFANDRLAARPGSTIEVAIEAGRTRLRPVLMTAGAMLLGMLPMAIGMGDAGEQNAPLGRAVIGGLVGATATTLWLVPIVYAAVRKGSQGPEGSPT